jgi:hypothetical protein
MSARVDGEARASYEAAILVTVGVVVCGCGQDGRRKSGSETGMWGVLSLRTKRARPDNLTSDSHKVQARWCRPPNQRPAAVSASVTFAQPSQVIPPRNHSTALWRSTVSFSTTDPRTDVESVETVVQFKTPRGDSDWLHALREPLRPSTFDQAAAWICTGRARRM